MTEKHAFPNAKMGFISYAGYIGMLTQHIAEPSCA